MAGRAPAWTDRLALFRPLAPYLALLAVSLVVHWPSLVEPGRPLYVDSDLPLTYADFGARYFHAWNANTGHFAFAQIMRVPYLLPLYLLFRGLGVDVTLFVTVLFWLPTFVGMVAGYAFFRYALADGAVTRRLAASERAGTRRFVAVCVLLGVLYGLSPWITKHFHHHFFRVSYAFLPLALLFFVRYVRAGRRRDLVAAALFVVLLSTNPHFVVYFFLLAGLFVLVDGGLSGRVATAVGRASAVVGLYVLFSLFWLLPFLSVVVFGESLVGYNVGERIVSLYSTRNTPVNLFSFMGGYWHGITRQPWWLFDPVSDYQLVFLSIPIAAVLGLLAADRDDRFALFAGVTIVAVLALATGYRYDGPVAAVYDLVVELPFHGVLRAPDRLLSILPLLYGYLIGRAILDGDRRLVRRGAAVLLVVACVAVVLTSLHVFTIAFAPTEVPDDHEHVATAGYEDVFVSPPRPLSGYNPDWMFSREGGIVDSWDTHLFARPDTRQHYLNYYVFELLDRGRTETALSILRKTGANHVAVRTDVATPRGIPPGEETIARLDEHATRVYSGERLVVFDVDGRESPFRVVRPVRAPRDLDAARSIAGKPGVYPTFPTREADDPLLSTLDGHRRFHPANTFRRINEMDSLSRPATDAGVIVRGQRTLDPPAGNGTLVVHATALSRGAELARTTDAGREVYKVGSGLDRVHVDLDGGDDPISVRGPLSVERLSVDPAGHGPVGFPITGSFRSAGTLTPDQTRVSFSERRSSVYLTYEVDRGGAFVQASYDVDPQVEGPLSVNVSLVADEGGDRLGVVLLDDAGETVFYASGERLRPGRQHVTFRVPDLGDAAIARIQLAVIPTERPTSDALTLSDVEVVDIAGDRPLVDARRSCDRDPAGPRCEGAARVTTVERVSPTRYDLTVDAESPYVLHFGESYDSTWVAEVDRPDGTSRYRARPLYLATNGFWIDETGEHTVTVRYRPQRWFTAGLVVSGLAVFVAVASLVVDLRGRRTVVSFDRAIGAGRRSWRTTVDRLPRLFRRYLP